MADAKVAQEVVSWVGADGRNYSYGKALKRTCANRVCAKSFEWDGNEYKTHCVDCYLKLARTCVACKRNKLKLNAPFFQKVCTTCFVLAKQQSYKVCPTCPPHRASHLRCPLNKEQCKECEVRLAPVSPVPEDCPIVQEELD